MTTNNEITQKYLAKLHTEILLVMDEIARICQKYDLDYYLMAGSCLGAIRHNGFIPWDDDLDIAMPRKDFERFVSLISGQTERDRVLDDCFYLRWVTTEKFYNQDFAKICLKSTVFQEDKGKASQNAGIYVDVFPLDATIPYCKKVERKSRVYNFLHGCLYLKGAEKEMMDWKIIHWPRNVIVKLFSNYSIYRMMLWVIKVPKGVKTNFQALFSTPYPIQRQIFPVNWHGEGRRVRFENRYYICPSEAEKVMQHMYGHDYMELPPENKRKTHCPIKVVFSDGETILFEKQKNEVKYEDLIGKQRDGI